MNEVAVIAAPQSCGERFGRYVLLELIGRGGMAEVYRAVAQGLEGFQRIFVIKRILREKSAAPEFVDMFVNEARISALLNHPNIVQIYDFGQIEGSYFLAMEHLRGRDLLSVLRQLRTQGKQMAPEVAAYVAHQVALGLDYAHSLKQGGRRLDIIHRDVSPSNIMLLRAGGVKLLDFGIAKATVEVRGENETEAGLVKGKLSYVSPEQIRGVERADGRADVFALGVVLWESLTGKRLFFDRNDFQTMRNVLERPVPPPSTQRMDIPATLDYIVLRALERQPERRYPTAKMMAEELEAFLQDARFAPRAMTRMLDDLFGEDGPQADLLPEQVVPLDSATGPTVLDRAFVDKNAPLPPLLVEGPSDLLYEEESYTGVSSVHRIQEPPVRRQRRRVLAGLGVVLAAAGLAFVVRPTQPTLPPEQAVSAVVAPAPEAAPEPEPAPPATISLRIESDPVGAEIKGEDGAVVGTTPLTLPLPRGARPLAFTATKAGFAPQSQTVVPDQPVSLKITLRPLADRAKKPDRLRPKGRGPNSDGRVREGLSIDPFAEENPALPR